MIELIFSVVVYWLACRQLKADIKRLAKKLVQLAYNVVNEWT